MCVLDWLGEYLLCEILLLQFVLYFTVFCSHPEQLKSWSYVYSYAVHLGFFFSCLTWINHRVSVLNIWRPSISPKEKDFPLACLISSFCLVFCQQTGPPAVSCPHPNPSSPRSPRPPAQGASVSTRYYVSYTLLHLLLPHSIPFVAHWSHGHILWKNNNSSWCSNSGVWPFTSKSCPLGQGGEQTIGLIPPLELLMCAGGHPEGSEEITWPWTCVTIWKSHWWIWFHVNPPVLKSLKCWQIRSSQTPLS